MVREVLQQSPGGDPSGPVGASCRVFRGGSWDPLPVLPRGVPGHAGYRNINLGFRLAPVLSGR